MRSFPVLLSFLLLPFASPAQNEAIDVEKINFPSLDGLKITADLYKSNPKSSTYIILCHQAGFSRGAYGPIAPKLVALGYNCLAIDQRSGNKAQGVVNETNERAVAANKKVKYIDAVQDVEAAFLYAKNKLKADKIIIWGSSYSASIVLYLGSKYPDQISGILSFSPGEYFTIDGLKIVDYAPKITCPVFITSAKNEKNNWADIYDSLSVEKYYFLPTDSGAHGSKALWPDKRGNEAYWEAVLKFLDSLGADSDG